MKDNEFTPSEKLYIWSFFNYIQTPDHLVKLVNDIRPIFNNSIYKVISDLKKVNQGDFVTDFAIDLLKKLHKRDLFILKFLTKFKEQQKEQQTIKIKYLKNEQYSFNSENVESKDFFKEMERRFTISQGKSTSKVREFKVGSDELKTLIKQEYYTQYLIDLLDKNHINKFHNVVSYLNDVKLLGDLDFTTKMIHESQSHYLLNWIFERSHSRTFELIVDKLKFCDTDDFGFLRNAVSICSPENFDIVIKKLDNDNIDSQGINKFLLMNDAQTKLLLSQNSDMCIERQKDLIDDREFVISTVVRKEIRNQKFNEDDSLKDIQKQHSEFGNYIKLMLFYNSIIQRDLKNSIEIDYGVLVVLLKKNIDTYLSSFKNVVFIEKLIYTIDVLCEELLLNSKLDKKEYLKKQNAFINEYENQKQLIKEELKVDGDLSLEITMGKYALKSKQNGAKDLVAKLSKCIDEIKNYKQPDKQYELPVSDNKKIIFYLVKSTTIQPIYATLSKKLKNQHQKLFEKIENGTKVLKKTDNEKQVGIVLEDGIIKFKSDTDIRLYTKTLYTKKDGLLIYFDEEKPHSTVYNNIKNKYDTVSLDSLDELEKFTNKINNEESEKNKMLMTCLFGEEYYDNMRTVPSIPSLYSEKELAQNKFANQLKVVAILYELANQLNIMTIFKEMEKFIKCYTQTTETVKVMLEDHNFLNEKLVNQAEWYLNLNVVYETFSDFLSNHGGSIEEDGISEDINIYADAALVNIMSNIIAGNIT